MSVENIGAFTPTGSKIKISESQLIVNAYLNIGTGNPWAGQRRAKLWLIVRKNKPLLLSVENAGAFAPTGSGKNGISIKSTIITQ